MVDGPYFPHAKRPRLYTQLNGHVFILLIACGRVARRHVGHNILMGEGRSILGPLLRWDNRVSASLYHWYQRTIGWRGPLMLLEYSGHGVPWLMVSSGFFLFTNKFAPSVYETLANLFLGLLTDLAWVVIFKSGIRRSRPVYNKGKQLGSVHVVDQVCPR